MPGILNKPFEEPTKGADAGKLWHRRIERAKEYRIKLWNADTQWRRAEALDRGDHWNDNQDQQDATSDNPRDRVKVNLTQSYVRDFIAFLFKYAPKFVCKARRAEDVDSAKIQAALVNYYWREKDWKKQARRAVRDLVKYGTGIIRTGWVLELDAAVDPDAHGLLDWDDAVAVNEPVVKRVNPARFLIDPMAAEKDLETARWCAEILHKPLSDVLANDNYDPDVRRRIADGELNPTPVTKEDQQKMKLQGQMALFDDNDLFAQADKSSTLVRVYDLWDKKYQRHYVLLDGVNDPLKEEKTPYPYLDGFPFVLAKFDELNDELYGMGLPSAMEDQQLELNRIRTAEFQHRRSYGRARNQILRGALQPAEQAKLRTDTDSDVLVDIPNAVQPLRGPDLPVDNYKIEEVIMADIRLLTGADQLMSGGSLPSRTSASEIQARSGYSGMKIDMRVDTVDCFLTDVTRQVLQHMKAWLDDATAVRIQGMEGEQWAEVDRTDIAADTDLEISTVSATRTDPQTERQQALMLADRLMQSMPVLQQAGYMVDVPALMRWIMVDQFELREYDDFVKRTAPPTMPGGSPPGASGDIGGTPPGPGVPPLQQGAQVSAVPASSAAIGGLMGGQ